LVDAIVETICGLAHHVVVLSETPPSTADTICHGGTCSPAGFEINTMPVESVSFVKLALRHFNRYAPEMGICQWFHYEDPRLDLAVDWLKRLGVKYLRTGVSWADWYRENAEAWFDRQMQALAEELSRGLMRAQCFNGATEFTQITHFYPTVKLRVRLLSRYSRALTPTP